MSPPPPDGNAPTTATAGIPVADAVPSTATGVESKPSNPADAETKFQHPLDPLTPEEIAAVTLAIRHYTASQTDIRAVKFITCTHLPPPKRLVLAALAIPTEPGKRVPKKEVDDARARIVRRAEADFLDVVAGRAYNATLALNPGPQTQTATWALTALTLLPASYHPQISVEELIAAEVTVKSHPTIHALAAAVGVAPARIFCDGWSIGYDERFPQARRVQQALVYARMGGGDGEGGEAEGEEHDNLYAHPMDFVPVIDANTNELLHVDFPAVYRHAPNAAGPGGGGRGEGKETDLVGAMKGVKLSAHSTAPPPLAADALAAAQRERIPPPAKRWDFLPDLMRRTADPVPRLDERGERVPVLDAKGERVVKTKVNFMKVNETGAVEAVEEEEEVVETEPWTTRRDLKPLHVVQPEGVSFKMDGHVLEWQNWKMHIAFTHREGIALSTITYNDHGEVRPILYRLSLAEMVVPYAAPEHPHPRKFAFDSGEYGMGTMANELSLGCDCLGQIHYLPGTYVAHDGSAVVIKNVICIHEEDAGVLWKHTDYRPGGRSHTVRRRRLVVSMVCTLANYEYIWNYHFYQDGSIEFEIRLTGILSVYVAQPGEPTPFGTTVAPGINAHYHQHMFSVRLDPMVDGLANTVIESDIKPVPQPTGSAGNFAGNAFAAHDTPITTEGARAYDYAAERRWRIVNRGRTHYASGLAAGYALGVKGGATPMMARGDGWAARRAAFLANTVWVCRDVEAADGLSGTERMWPAGKYVPQTTEEPEDSVGSWVKEARATEDEDVLVFVTVGTTHIPRPEDWPVMPVEHLSVTLKPTSFFTANPSMDVPGSNDPLSVAAFGDNKATSNSCCK